MAEPGKRGHGNFSPVQTSSNRTTDELSGPTGSYLLLCGSSTTAPLVGNIHVKDSGNNGAFPEKFHAIDAVHRVIGMDCNDADRGVVLFQRPSRPHDGPAGADAGDEMGNAAPDLCNDLRAGSRMMSFPVGGIVELVGLVVAFRIFVQDLPGKPDGAVGALERAGEYQLGPLPPEDPLLS